MRAFLPAVLSIPLASFAARSAAPEVDALFAAYNRPDAPGASVMVISRGRVVMRQGYGSADLEKKAACTPQTNYRLASMTKPFTAMAVMMLVERRKLSYDDRLTDLFPGFPEYGRQIAVRHLLTHTSGLLDYEDLIPQGTTTQLKDRDVLEILRRQDRTYFAPGSEFRYSNSGYALLALAVERASETRFAEFLKRNIFEPLGMKRTVAYEHGISTVSNRAYGYTARDGRFERTDQSLTSAVLGDGGVYSSIEDLARWDQALYTTRLIGASSMKQAFTPATLSDGRRTAYGFGWFIESRHTLAVLRHTGNTVGFTNVIERFPDRQLTVVLLTNRNDGDAPALARGLADLSLAPPPAQ